MGPVSWFFSQFVCRTGWDCWICVLFLQLVPTQDWLGNVSVQDRLQLLDLCLVSSVST